MVFRSQKLQPLLAPDCSSSINFKVTAACVGSKAKLTAKQHLVKDLARRQIAFKLETVLLRGTEPKIGPAKAGPTGLVLPPMITK